MWEHDNTDFSNLYSERDLQMDDPEFKQKLNKLGLENELIEINYYIPPYSDQIDLKLNLSLGQPLSTYWLALDPSSIFSHGRIKVDKHVYEECVKICKEYGFEGHEENLACIVKFGYIHYAYASYVSKQQQDKLKVIRELKNFCKVAFSGEEVKEILFKGEHTKDKVSLKSDIMIQFVTNGIAKVLFEHIKSGWLNVLRVDSITITEWNIRYRNIFLFMLVCYLHREVGFIKVDFTEENKVGKIHLNKDVVKLIVRLFDIAKVELKASKKWDGDNYSDSPELALIRSHLNSALKSHPEFEKFLYDGPYSEEEYLALDAVFDEESEKNKADLLDRFLNKKGLE